MSNLKFKQPYSAGKTEAIRGGSDREGAAGTDPENSEREAGILGSYLFY